MKFHHRYPSIARLQTPKRVFRLMTISWGVAIGFALVCQPLQAADGWVALKESHTDMRPGDSDLVRIWKDALDREAAQVRADGGTVFIKGQETVLPTGGFKPTDFLAVDLSGRKATYIVSIMFQRPPVCDNGANSASAEQTPPICPVRVTIIPKDGSPATIKEAKGACGIQPSLWDGSPRDTGTFVRLVADRIELESVVSGKPLPGCSLSIPLS